MAPPDLTALLRRERERLLADRSGEVSEGTPLLAAAGPECFALAAVTLDGERHETEEADLEFSVQSVVKPWIYAVALLDHGDRVHEVVGVEPTGAPFDALVLEASTGRPPNPMVNAGALVASSLVSGDDVEHRVRRVVEVCSAAADRDLEVDAETVEHELAHADRNRALAYLMRDTGSLTCDVEVAVEVLARCCALRVTVRDLASMAATLAGWGRHPGTGARVLPPAVVTDVLSVMATCGMYDGVGTWVHQVGMPAKSGVSGALMAVAPGTLGLAGYSAPLDEHGNSVRGVAAFETVADELRLHRFAPPDWALDARGGA